MWIKKYPYFLYYRMTFNGKKRPSIWNNTTKTNNKQLENKQLDYVGVSNLYKSCCNFRIQYLSWNPGFTMNAFFALTLLAAAVSAQDCPEMPPIECGPEDMNCYGGMNAAGCPMPDICSPTMMGDCPGHCPTFCGPEQMMCPGPVSAVGNCMSPDICVDIRGKFQMIFKVIMIFS